MHEFKLIKMPLSMQQTCYLSKLIYITVDYHYGFGGVLICMHLYTQTRLHTPEAIFIQSSANLYRLWCCWNCILFNVKHLYSRQNNIHIYTVQIKRLWTAYTIQNVEWKRKQHQQNNRNCNGGEIRQQVFELLRLRIIKSDRNSPPQIVLWMHGRAVSQADSALHNVLSVAFYTM